MRYKDYAPTGFDRKGAFLHDQSDWYVSPCIQTRDSGPLDQSNFETALEILGGESSYVEVHRFGHWGPGWFEIIIVKPTAKKTVQKLQSIYDSLADYPLLDEMDYSKREWEEKTRIWNDCYNLGERIELCQKHGESIFAARHETIPGNVWEDIHVE
jgi:hypothetical protein